MRLGIIRPLRPMRAPSCQYFSIQQPALQDQRRFCSFGDKVPKEVIELRNAAMAHFYDPENNEVYHTVRTLGGFRTYTHELLFAGLYADSTTFTLAVHPYLNYQGSPAVVFVPDPDRVKLLLNGAYFTPEVPNPISDADWFLADFGVVDKKLGEVVTAEELKQRLVNMLPGETFADAIRKKVAKEKSPFAHFVSQNMETELRPPITREQLVEGLMSASPHRLIPEKNETQKNYSAGNIFEVDIEAVLQKPIVINGSSGSGKTVLALRTAKALADVFLVDDPMGVVLGLYLKPSDKPGEKGLSVATRVAAYVASELRELLNKVFKDLKPKERSLKNVLLHVVLDEVGSLTELCNEILDSHIAICNEIKIKLSERGAAGDEGYEGCAIQEKDGLKISLTLAGTGVAYPNAKGSLGLPYWRVSSDTASLEVMGRVLNEDRGLNVENMVKSVKADRLLSILVGNKRMAAQMAKVLLEYKVFSGDLSAVSSAVALATVKEYVGANSWNTIMDEETHLSNLLSLLTTQSHGCHVLSRSDLAILTTKVGAVEDMLEWRDTDDQQSFEHPVDATVNSDLLKSYAGKLQPLVEASNWPNMKPYFRTRQPGKEDPNGRIRYHIPPALALMALIRYAVSCCVWLFSSDQQNSAVTYEKFTAVILAATLNAFSSHNVLEFPAHLLFLRTEGSVNEFLKTQPPMVSLLQEGHMKRNHVFPIEFDWLRCKDKHQDDGLAPLTKPETAFVVEVALPQAAQNDCILHGKGLAIGIENKFYLDEGVVSASVLVKRACQMGYSEVCCEFPCPEAPVPQITTAEAPVPVKATAPALLPNATKDPSQKEKQKYAKLTVTKELHDFFTSQDSDIIEFKSFKYDKAEDKAMVTISTEKAAMRSKDTKLAMVRSCWLAKRSKLKLEVLKDVVVLSGPSGQSLIPKATTVVFKNPYEIELWRQPEDTRKPITKIEFPWNPMKTGNVKFKFSLAVSASDPPRTADVVTWKLSLERFLSATSIQPIEDRSETPPESILYSCNEEKDDKEKLLFVGKTFYLTRPNNQDGLKFTITVPWEDSQSGTL